MNKNNILQDAGSKRFFATDDEDRLLVEYLDVFVNSSGENKKTVVNKGVFTNQVTTCLSEYLQGFNIPTLFVRQISDTEMLIKNVVPVPLKAVVQNFASASLFERYGFKAEQELENSVVEFFMNDPARQNPMINETHMAAFGLVSCAEAQLIKRLCTKVNAILKSFFLRRDSKLLKFSLEFGYFKNKLVLNNDFSLETLHLLDLQSGVKYDEEFFNGVDSEIDSAMNLLLEKITGGGNNN